MKRKIYIIYGDKPDIDYAEKLSSLISNRVFEIELRTFKDHEKLGNGFIEGKDGLIFIGTEAVKQYILEVNGVPWVYNRFGCYIGMVKNKCVIFANATDLPRKEYNEFIKYCKSVNLKHRDVIVPPEGMHEQFWEDTKKLFGQKESNTVNRAQYNTLLYEFVEKHFDDFLNSIENSVKDGNTTKTSPELKEEVEKAKMAALAQLTWQEALSCHAIIHSAAIACGAVAFVPVPVADTIPITSAQVGMVVALGKVFNNKISKSDAMVLLKTLAAPLAGRSVSKIILAFVPGVGWGINGAVAFSITEILGWTVANDFASKKQKLHGKKTSS